MSGKGSNMGENKKPHAVVIAFPFQGHVKPLLKVAKLLYHKGFHITFVNTEFNHRRFLKSRGSNSLDGLPDFQFETIPDGLPPSNPDASQDVLALCKSVETNFLAPFRDIIVKLNNSSTNNILPVTHIISDCLLIFTVEAAQEFNIPVISFFPSSATVFVALKHFKALKEKGYVPVTDESYLTNEFLDTIIDWIPSLKDIRLKDFPSYLRITDPNDFMFHLIMEAIEGTSKSSAMLINTFDTLEREALVAISSIFPHVYTIGPLQLLLNHTSEYSLESVGYNLWKEETECLEWLEPKEPNSVIYVNFGSITVLSNQQLLEFGMGLVNSKQPFLWIIRPDLVIGENASLPTEFVAATQERGFIASWCPQEKVLNHPSIGGFLTHCGWNSTIECLSAGVPMLCWPFFADQQTNCWSICKKFEVGLEIPNNVNRNEVEELVRELMETEKGKMMKKAAKHWKRLADEAAAPNGSSTLNLDDLVSKMRQS